MKKIEDEVMMVAFDYNVMTYRQYGDDLLRHTSNGSDQSFKDGQDSARNRLINDSFEMADRQESESMGLGVSPML